MILPTFLNILFITYFLNCFLDNRVRKRLYVVLLMIILSLVLAYVNHYGLTMLGRILSFSLFYLYSLICFQESKIKVTCIYFIGYFILIFSEFITLAIVDLMSGYISFDPITLLLMMTLCTQIFNYGTGYTLKWFFYHHTAIAAENGILLHMVPLMLTAFFIMNISDSRVLFGSNALLLIAFFLLIIIDLFSIVTMKYSLDHVETKKELELSQTKSDMLKSQYELVYTNYTINFSFLHDSIHTLSNLKQLIEQNRIEDFYTELDEFADQTQRNLYQIYSNSPAISAFLLENKEILSRCNISIHSTLKSKNLDMTLSCERSKFIHILLNYAVRICEKMQAEEKIIIVKSDDIGTKASVFKMMFTATRDMLTDPQTIAVIERIKREYTERVDMIYKEPGNMIEIVVLFS